jgi:IS605 OrfB family transposase
VQLLPTTDQAGQLLAVLERCNDACNWISERAWVDRTFGRSLLHRLVYYQARERFGLPAQAVVRAIAKVVDAYGLDKLSQRTFRRQGGCAFDDRMLAYRLNQSTVSILTLEGRQTIPFVCGDRQRELLLTQRGESDVVFRDGKWYLFARCEVETPDERDIDSFLGVDMGVVNIAADSDGETFSGSVVNALRHRNRGLRRKLQAKGTHSSRRRLAHRRRKEARFARDVNHCISKHIVAKAQDTGRGIAVEELTGIRDRITARKPQRATMSSWAFAQLRAFLTYKAARAGVPLVAVDPRNTSRECPRCGCIDKRSRPTQSRFSCIGCGLAGPADTFAAVNIGRRAAVNRPNVRAGAVDFQSSAPVPGTSYRLLAGSR